jgi:peptidoglycan/LPS O-acetylase OafA/YrhL
MTGTAHTTTVSGDLVAPERFPHLAGLDGLRAIAVMAVLFYHADFAWAKGGFLGVEVFFVISGYLITSLLLVEWLRTDTINLKAFWVRRARRLLPAVFVMLGVVAVGSILFLRDSLYRLGGDVVAASAYVTNWFLIIREDSYFEAFGRPPLLQHLWSLSVEEQFYVLWPIIFSVGLLIIGGASKHATVRRFRALVVVGIIASTVLMAVLFEPFEDPSRVYYGTDTRAAGILIGVALALWWMPWRMPQTVSLGVKRSLSAAGFSALGVLTIILVGLSEFSPWLYRGGFALTSLLTATVIAVIAHPAVGFGVVLSNPVMRWIGIRSYGIYLWHWPIFMVTRPGFDVEFDATAVFVVRLALTFGVAELSYRFVEAPIRKVGYRKWMRGITANLGVGSPRSASAAAVAMVTAFLLVAGGLVLGSLTDQPGTVVASPSDGGVSVVEVEDPPAPDGLATQPQPVDASEESAIRESTTRSESADVTDPTVATEPLIDSITTIEQEEPPSAVAVEPLRVTLIGDSVLKGAEGAVVLELGSETIVDATVNRQFKDTNEVVADLRARGELGDAVVIHLGTNGAFSGASWDEAMSALGDVERVYVLTSFVPRRWESTVNAAIASGIERWPRVEIIDYKSFGEAHPEYYNSDGVHLNARGQAAYAEFIHRALNR